MPSMRHGVGAAPGTVGGKGVEAEAACGACAKAAAEASMADAAEPADTPIKPSARPAIHEAHPAARAACQPRSAIPTPAGETGALCGEADGALSNPIKPAEWRLTPCGGP
jgi:hypothetical protein